MRLDNYYPNTSMETIFMDTEISKMSEPHKFVLCLSQILDLRSSNKHVALQNWSIYHTWKNIRKSTKTTLNIIAPTWRDEFELPDRFYSVSDIQDYIEYIIKESETLSNNPPIHIYINRININRSLKYKLLWPINLVLIC